MAASGAGSTAGAGASASAAPLPAPGTVKDITSEAEFDAVVAASRGLVTVFFWEDFHEASRQGGQMDMVVSQLSRVHTDVTFVKVQAEVVPEVSDRYDISAVPTFVFLAGTKFLGKQEGANAPMLAQNVVKFKTRSVAVAAAPDESSKTPEDSKKELNERLHKLINTAHIMLFMKGTPQEPRCKFSRRVVELLTAGSVTYSAFNILNDNAVRQGLKEYSSWPTFPQLYAAGRLVGGHDVIVEMAEEDPSLPSLQPPKAADSLEDRLRALISRSPVMLFMKGSPDEPRCGFSRQAVALLREHSITFDSFDILTDNSVRQGLKTFSNWPTYPQLYVQGNLVGGLDIMKQTAEDEEDGFAEALGIPTKEDLNTRLRKLINQSRIVLFMKGSPDEPRCGFSRQAVALMREARLDYTHFDILTDNDVRQGIKTFSNWPTFPQLYVEGKLVGGLDIMKELAEENELADLSGSAE